MLFHSFTFAFLFLPLVLVANRLSARHSNVAVYLLIAASVIFYSFWNAQYLGLLVASILVNYSLSLGALNSSRRSNKLMFLIIGLGCNLMPLFYFKYSSFLIRSVNQLLGLQIPWLEVGLPLAISFYTFQQIAFLVDCYRGNQDLPKFHEYVFFVVFFPQLIAGPIVHLSEILPQLRAKTLCRMNGESFLIGFCLFVSGMFKKMVVAEPHDKGLVWKKTI